MIVDVKKDFGCVGDGVALDGANFQRAISAVMVSPYGGGRVFVPAGRYNLAGGIIVPSNVWLEGEQRNCSILQSLDHDGVVVTVGGGSPKLTDLTILGRGADGMALATRHALVVNSVEGIFRDILIAGGASAIYAAGVDNTFENIKATQGTGRALVTSVGADWYVRCKFDAAPGWQQQVAGISFLDGAGENHLTQIDLSGSFVNSIEFDAGPRADTPPIVVIGDSIMSAGVTLIRGEWFCMHHCELGGGDVAVNPSYAGGVTIDGNRALSPVRILIGSSLCRGVIANNDLPGSLIRQQALNTSLVMGGQNLI